MNVDLHPGVACARVVDVRKPLPFATHSIDMCYSSHLLEHLSASEAMAFLAEQRRVLKPQGVIRVVVPDLGELCRTFAALQPRALAGDEQASYELEYTYLELFDQATRTSPGGELYAAWLACPAEHRGFVEQRAGDEYRAAIARKENAPRGFSALLRPYAVRRAWRVVRERLIRGAGRALLGRRGAEAVREGLFRATGEIHRVMYDEARLARRLLAAGFQRPTRMTATESHLPGFAGFGLDAAEGRVRKPDSLFMEAVA